MSLVSPFRVKVPGPIAIPLARSHSRPTLRSRVMPPLSSILSRMRLALPQMLRPSLFGIQPLASPRAAFSTIPMAILMGRSAKPSTISIRSKLTAQNHSRTLRSPKRVSLGPGRCRFQFTMPVMSILILCSISAKLGRSKQPIRWSRLILRAAALPTAQPAPVELLLAPSLMTFRIRPTQATVMAQALRVPALTTAIQLGLR